MTLIPAGFQGVFPFHPLTHIPPRLIAGIVPSPFPNFTPDLTSGIAPLRVTAASIHCCLANGKSSGVRSVVALSQPFEGSLTSHWHQPSLSEDSQRQYHPLLLTESHPARILLACTSKTSLFLYRGHTSSRSSSMGHLAICHQRHPTGRTYWTSRGLDQVR
jgi:hypothetical protein